MQLHRDRVIVPVDIFSTAYAGPVGTKLLEMMVIDPVEMFATADCWLPDAVMELEELIVICPELLFKTALEVVPVSKAPVMLIAPVELFLKAHDVVAVLPAMMREVVMLSVAALPVKSTKPLAPAIKSAFNVKLPATVKPPPAVAPAGVFAKFVNVANERAVPVPLPLFVARNIVPTVAADEPIEVQFVDPKDSIW